MSARTVATEVLRRVASDGAWASPTLDVEIGRARLSQRDAALATAIVYGTLRLLPAIDRSIDAHADRTDPFVRAALRAAVFQLHFLERVPSHAIVDETVSLVRSVRGKPVSGFVNAVLRKIARQEPKEATGLELPEWAAHALDESVGVDRAHTFRHADGAPSLDLRVVGDRPQLLAALEEAGHEAQPVGRVGVRLFHAGDPRKLPGFDDGAFYVQELGSQEIVDAVDAQPGDSVADLCAGRGGKTLGLLDAVGFDGRVTAVELHEARLEQIPDAANRLGLGGALEIETVDLRVGGGGLGEFDRVLVDAPCSGLGTVHRRPEILLRVTEEDVAALIETQAKILRTAMTLVRPGGLLVFAVCSFLAREGAAHRRELDWALDRLDNTDEDGCLRLGPWTSPPTDVYQVLRWRRPE